MRSGRVAASLWAGTIRRLVGAVAVMLPLTALPAAAQTFTGAPVVFGATGSNGQQTQTANITVATASTIRSISIPLSFTGSPEFTLIDQGGCAEDGTTVNPAGTVCNLTIRFRPAFAGIRTASLIVTDGSGNATAFGLWGVGFYAQTAITPSAEKIVTGAGPNLTGHAVDGSEAAGAQVMFPQGVAADSFGNLYIMANTPDGTHSQILMLDAFGNMTVVAGGGSSVGAAANGGLATGAQLSLISYLTVDSAGNLYFSDSTNNVVWRVAMSTSRKMTAVAGSFAQGFSGDGGPATSATMHTPLGIVTDGIGNLYIADSQNQRIRMVDTTGTISTFAGSGAFGFDPGPVAALSAQFGYPTGLAIDAQGNLYVSEPGYGSVRKISAGNVTVVAGTGTSGNTGDGGPATSAQLNYPQGIAISASGDIFIADGGAGVIRKVQASDGVIETFAGEAKDAGSYSSGVTPSTQVRMNGPVGLAFDSQQNLFVADSGNSVIREFSTAPGDLLYAARQTGSPSSPSVMKIANIGNAPLSLVSVAAANSTTSSNFTLTNSTTTPCGSTVVTGAHCEYTVVFTPAIGTSAAGEIDVTTVANNPNFTTVTPVYLNGGLLSPITIGPDTLDSIIQGRAATATITASGGYGTLTVEVSGDMPTGVTANSSSGVVTLTGTPTVVGNYNFTIYASDVLGETAEKTYTLQVLPSTISYSLSESVHVTDTVVALAPLTFALNETVHVTDSLVTLAPLSFALAETVHVTDSLTETPVLVSSVAEVVHISDSVQFAPGTPLSLAPTTAALIAGTVNASYTSSVFVAGGVGALTLTATGTVPGLTTTQVGNTLIVNGTPTTAGVFSLSITATDGLLDTITKVYSISIGMSSQTISAPTLGTHVYGDTAFGVSANSSSGLPVTITVMSGPATITNSIVDMTGGGVVTLLFSQAGNANYSAAPSVQRSFTVTPASATIVATNMSRAFETLNPTFLYTATGLVHGDTIATLGGTPALTTTAVLNSPGGTYPITAAQGTLPTNSYTFSFTGATLTVVGHTAQTITFNKIPNVPLSVGNLTLTAHSTSSLAITYSVTGPATVTNNQLHLTGAGLVTVTASQAGNATFDPAPSVTRSFTVTP